MNKRGWEIAKLAQFILVVIALIILFNFVKGKMAYGSGIFSNLFGKVNESIGGVSWSDLTKAQRDIMNDKQKAEAMFIEIDKELNRGIEKRKNKDFDEAKSAFEKALNLVNQVLNLKEINPKQIERAKGLETTLKYYLKDLGEYKGVAEFLEKAKTSKTDEERLGIFKKCEEAYPRSVRSIDCVARAYLLKVDPAFAHTVPAPALKLLDNWLREQIARINNDHPNLLSKAIDHYNAAINNPDSKDLNDYVGRAHLRKAQIYRDYSMLLGYSDQKRYESIRGEYDTLFKKLEKREFVDKQEALNGQRALSCFGVATSDRNGQKVYSLKVSAYGPVYFYVVSLAEDKCPLSGEWMYNTFLVRKDNTREKVFAGGMPLEENPQNKQIKNPKTYLLNEKPGNLPTYSRTETGGLCKEGYVNCKSLTGYDRLVFEAYKVENEKDKATLELPITQ